MRESSTQFPLSPLFNLSLFFREGTNALPIWTMTDLLQINGNGLNPMGTTAKDSICPAAQLHTKRYINALKVSADGEPATNVNHKRPSAVDTSPHKRMKSSSDSAVRMHHARQLAQPLATNYMRPYQVQKSGQQQPQTAPHLLQQLMAPMARTRKHSANTSADPLNGGAGDSQWNRARSQQLIYQQNGNELGNSSNVQASNSVLKNLLVSGCDISAGYICTIPKRAAKA